jgi:hypothetical protein
VLQGKGLGLSLLAQSSSKEMRLFVSPKCAASHPVEAPVEALRCRAENNRKEDPSARATDDDCHGRRQVAERQRESGTDDSPR